VVKCFDDDAANAYDCAAVQAQWTRASDFFSGDLLIIPQPDFVSCPLTANLPLTVCPYSGYLKVRFVFPWVCQTCPLERAELCSRSTYSQNTAKWLRSCREGSHCTSVNRGNPGEAMSINRESLAVGGRTWSTKRAGWSPSDEHCLTTLECSAWSRTTGAKPPGAAAARSRCCSIVPPRRPEFRA
jgi:hypothetical protein